MKKLILCVFVVAITFTNAFANKVFDDYVDLLREMRESKDTYEAAGLIRAKFSEFDKKYSGEEIIGQGYYDRSFSIRGEYIVIYLATGRNKYCSNHEDCNYFSVWVIDTERIRKFLDEKRADEEISFWGKFSNMYGLGNLYLVGDVTLK